MRKSAEALASGHERAYRKFAEFVIDAIECDKATAEKLCRFYLKTKLMKLDAIHGSFHVKHGGLLETEVLWRAVALMNS